MASKHKEAVKRQREVAYVQKKEDKKTALETKSINDIIPIVDTFKGCFKLKDGTFMDIVQVKCKDLVNASESDVNFDMYSLTKLYRAYTDDLKIISLNFPTNTKLQQIYFQHKINHTANPLLKNILNEKYEKLVDDELHSTNREHYIMYFGKTYERLLNNLNTITASLGTSLVELCSMSKKIQMLFSVTNMASVVFYDDTADRRINPPNKEELVEKYGYNPYLLQAIQPMGGIKFSNDDYIRTGDGYVTCLYVYGYPKIVDRHWLNTLCNNRGTVTTIDVTTVDSYNVKKDLRKSIAEYRGRERTAKNTLDAMDAADKRDELSTLVRDVNYGEVIKRMTTRVFLADTNYENLMKTVRYYKKNVFEDNEYQVAINLNEMQYEWTSMFKSYSMQSADYYSRRTGKAIASSTLAGGDAFHFTSLNDEFGSDFGHTLSNGYDGRVLLDMFEAGQSRSSYNFLLVGLSGVGKSTLLKKIMVDRAARGDYLRVIDVAGDFTQVCHSLGGKVVYLDGSDGGRLNPLQINKADDTDAGSYDMNITKMANIYSFLAPEASDIEKRMFKNILHQLYKQFGITKDTPNLTELPAKAYPRMEDILPIIDWYLSQIQHGELQEGAMSKEEMQNEEMRTILLHIKLVIVDVIQSNANIFNSYSDIDNLIDTQVVVYNLKKLDKKNDNEVFKAQVFSALSLCWANAVKVGTITNKMVNSGQIDLIDAKHFLLLIDESHRTINRKNPQAVEQVLNYVRQGRKFYAGLGFASQDINDFIPAGVNADSQQMINTLFAQCQYKFLLKQDSKALPSIDSAFGGSLTQSELAMIPTLNRGEVILNISGDKNVAFKVEASDDELAVFGGGT